MNMYSDQDAIIKRLPEKLSLLLKYLQTSVEPFVIKTCVLESYPGCNGQFSASVKLVRTNMRNDEGVWRWAGDEKVGIEYTVKRCAAIEVLPPKDVLRTLPLQVGLYSAIKELHDQQQTCKLALGSRVFDLNIAEDWMSVSFSTYVALYDGLVEERKITINYSKERDTNNVEKNRRRIADELSQAAQRGRFQPSGGIQNAVEGAIIPEAKYYLGGEDAETVIPDSIEWANKQLKDAGSPNRIKLIEFYDEQKSIALGLVDYFYKLRLGLYTDGSERLIDEVFFTDESRINVDRY